MTFHCALCDIDFTMKGNLKRHNFSKSHLEKVAKENLKKDISILEIVQRLENRVEFLETQHRNAVVKHNVIKKQLKEKT